MARTAIIMLAMLARSAAAEPGDDGYRMQTAIADGAALTACAIGGAIADHTNGATQKPGEYAIAGYLLAVPIVHAVHGRPGIAAGSFVLRIIATATAAAIMARLSNDDPTEVATAAFVAGIGVSVLDTVVFAAGDKVEPARHTWTPTVRASQTGFALGVQSSF